jgi:hypothetical protein
MCGVQMKLTDHIGRRVLCRLLAPKLQDAWRSIYTDKHGETNCDTIIAGVPVVSTDDEF